MDIVGMMRDYGVDLTEPQASQLINHLDLVLEANQTMNLTAVTNREDALALHVIDSLLAVPMLSKVQEGPVLDLGSGAGYPGIPLAITSNRHFVLLDSVKKKAVFLNACVSALSLPRVEVRALRAEELAAQRDCRNSFAAVTARAVSKLPSLLELSAPLLAQGGSLIALKARPGEDEIESAREVAMVLGMVEAGVTTHTLPDGSVRQIRRYDRVADPQIVLPRRIGLAQKRPLGGTSS